MNAATKGRLEPCHGCQSPRPKESAVGIVQSFSGMTKNPMSQQTALVGFATNDKAQ